MVYYFILQWRMLNRLLKNWGLNVFLAYPLMLSSFILISKYLFLKSGYAEYVYVLIPVFLITGTAERSKKEFLRVCFSTAEYLGIRVLENVILALPFILYLLYVGKFLVAGILLLFSVGLSLLNFGSRSSFVIPTPFSKFPFEFLVGFRRTFWFLLMAYILGIIALLVGNVYLGLFSLLLVILNCFFYYTTPEREFYVWISCLMPQSFIWGKAKVAITYTTVLCLPLAALLAAGFPDQMMLIAGLQLLGYVYVILALLSKYANYPNEIIFPEMLGLMISMILPPLLLITLPYFYLRSQRKLKEILA